MKVLVLLLLGIVGSAYCYEQSVAVEGHILCHGKPYHGAQISLMEKDLVDPDDLLDKAYSDHGSYRLNGWENELLRIEPYLKIVHTCKRDITAPTCERTFEIRIPEEAISDTREINKYFKVNNIELTDRRNDEWTNC